MTTRSALPAAVLAALALGLLFGPGARSSEGAYSISNQYYEHKTLGFKFRPMAEWTSFPAQPKDTVTVVRFRSDKADRGYVAEPSCNVAHLTTESEHKNIEEYLRARFQGRVTVGLKEDKVIPASKLPNGSKVFALTLSAGGEGAQGYAAEFKREKDSILVIYYCSNREFQKKYQKPFIYSLASFKFTSDAPVEDTGSPDGADGDQTAIERRYDEIVKQGVPPGWNVIKIPYYIIYYNCDNEDLIATVNRLKIIRPAYHKYFPPMNKAFVDNAAPIVRVVGTQRDFMTYSGMSGGVGGYWSPGVEELVVFRKSTAIPMKELYFDILHHEGFHQYIYYACGGVSPCITFNEGPAEFFGAFKQRGNQMVPTLENQLRKPHITGAVNTGGYVPIKTLLRYSQRQYYSNSMVCYAEGWALTSFLMMGRGYLGAQYKKEWEDIIPTYFEVLQAEVKKEYDKLSERVKGEVKDGSDRDTIGFLGSPEIRDAIHKKAMDEAVKDVDLDELEEVWKFFVKKKL